MNTLQRKFRYRGFVYYENGPDFELTVGVRTYRCKSYQSMQLCIDEFIGDAQARLKECYPKEIFDESSPPPSTHTIEFPTPAGQAGGVPIRFRLLSRISEWWRSGKVHGSSKTAL